MNNSIIIKACHFCLDSKKLFKKKNKKIKKYYLIFYKLNNEYMITNILQDRLYIKKLLYARNQSFRISL